ncbi:long-chain fatty acid--CoA ligase [Gemmatimonas sp.]|nr:long-chain fatty acid--CoA ligase [Gemmatimonas sp.]MCA2986728.1 long-chain fatty acid--CoA ligase [Gemmatimonas sp.]MCA2991606.1 long-chain fatty acid--CoA ligase [Gemmatimonas sp.]MCZ8268302.1 long-chain fatty acid--CoA ligase [Gemmatimonas sp.]
MTSFSASAVPSLNNTLAGIPSPLTAAVGGPRPAPGTINALFFDAVERFDRADALLYKVNGVWEPTSHAGILTRVRHIALGLARLGIVAQDRVGLLSENRPEWLLADYACLCSSVTDVPIYPTLPAEQIPYLLNDSGARALFVSTPEQARKVASVRAQAPGVEWIIGFAAGKDDGCDYTLAELEALGAADDSRERATLFKEQALAVTPDQLVTLIYTSGTTGNPKGVMLTQDNLSSNVMATKATMPVSTADTALSFLPLSHIFERTGDYFLFANGVRIAYAESIDTVPVNMSEVKPSLMMSVPRLYEKIYARVLENAVSTGGLKKQIFFWAKRVGERWADEKLAGREPAGLLGFQYRLADRLVFSKLRERTGGNIRYFISGGAPLSPEIAKFFYSAGLIILEGYGLTETSPVISANNLRDYRLGTVGKPIAGVEVRIAKDGEILTRGPHVMRGYYNNEQATRECLTDDGWFHTGDIGVLEDGFLRITDRKKDIIVTAGGKNIAPQPIENMLKTNKYVSQAVMLGDKRKFPVVLIVPDWDPLEKWAARNQIVWTSRAELMNMPTIQAKVEKEVQEQLKGLASYEMPKKVKLIEHDFSIERGELTPTLKVKRRVIDQTYKAQIDELYAGAD